MKGYFKGDPFKNFEELFFFEKDGKLFYKYKKQFEIPTKFHAASYRIYSSSGEVPNEIFKNGKEAIRQYVENEIKNNIEIQKNSQKKHDEFAKNPNFDITVEHNGKTLNGKIISADDGALRVRLEKPYSGETFIIFGFASAMHGHYIFDKNGKFSKYAVQRAKGLLIDLYNAEKHKGLAKKVIDAAEQLNRDLKKSLN